MKRIVSILLTAAFAVTALAGCTGGTGGTDKSSSQADGSSAAGGNAPAALTTDISVVDREDGSGTKGAFIELMGIEEKDANGNKVDKTTEEAITANKTDVMLTQVSSNESAIGYVSLGSLSDAVKAVKVDGVEATGENVKSGTYKVARPFVLATKGEPTGLAKDFMDYILSAEGQTVVQDNGYIKIADGAAAYAGNKPSGKIVIAGSSSVTPVMEKLKEAYIALNPNATIEVQQSDSSAGMQGTVDGTCDIGMASRELKDSEKAQVTGVQIALDGIAVIVSLDNPVADLSSETIKNIYTGQITSWSQIK